MGSVNPFAGKKSENAVQEDKENLPVGRRAESRCRDLLNSYVDDFVQQSRLAESHLRGILTQFEIGNVSDDFSEEKVGKVFGDLQNVMQKTLRELDFRGSQLGGKLITVAPTQKKLILKKCRIPAKIEDEVGALPVPSYKTKVDDKVLGASQYPNLPEPMQISLESDNDNTDFEEDTADSPILSYSQLSDESPVPSPSMIVFDDDDAPLSENNVEENAAISLTKKSVKELDQSPSPSMIDSGNENADDPPKNSYDRDISFANTQAVPKWNLEGTIYKECFTNDESSGSEFKQSNVKNESSGERMSGSQKQKILRKRQRQREYDYSASVPSNSTDEDRDVKIIKDCCVKLHKLPAEITDLLAGRSRARVTIDEYIRLAGKHALNYLGVDANYCGTANSLSELDIAIRRLNNFDGKVSSKKSTPNTRCRKVEAGGNKREKSPGDNISSSDEGSATDSSTEHEAIKPISSDLNLIASDNQVQTEDFSDKAAETDSDSLPGELNDSDAERDAKYKLLTESKNPGKSDEFNKGEDNSVRQDGRTNDMLFAEEKRVSAYVPNACRGRPHVSETDSDTGSDASSIVIQPKQAIKRRISSSSEQYSSSNSSKKRKRPVMKKKKRSTDVITISSSESDQSETEGKNTNINELSTENEISSESSFTGSRNVGSSRRARRYPESDDDDFRDSKPYIPQSHRGSQVHGSSRMTAGDNLGPKKQRSKEEQTADSNTEAEVEQNSQNSLVVWRGRRNIRKILEGNVLSRETQEAEDSEEERKHRLAERQAMFNQFKSPLATTVPEDNVILDIDPQTKEVLVKIDPSIVKCLKPHQVEGIKFMWDNCFESVKLYKQQGADGGSGCILAHCMGLGKTLQAVGFIHTIMTNRNLSIKTVLIVCPLNTVHNWNKELKYWLREASKKLRICRIYENKTLDKRLLSLEDWNERGGVAIINYEGFRNIVRDDFRRDGITQNRINRCFLDPGPDVVICDEGHMIKNCESQLSIAMNRIRTKRRVVLTGTPLQNNLMEYHTMMHFVKKNLLGTRKEFANRFANPIKNGQHRDSSGRDVHVMKRRAHVLHKLLESSVQRKDYSILVPFLPPKYEYAIVINMTEIQKKLYNAYLSLIGGGDEVVERIKMGFFLGDFAWLSKIWSHPFNLTRPTVKNKGRTRKIRDDLSESDDNKEDDLPVINEEAKPKGILFKGGALIRSEMEKFRKLNERWWEKFFHPNLDSIRDVEHSAKFTVLRQILRTSALIGDKVLIFSQYLYSLDLVEELLKHMDRESEEREDHGHFDDDTGRWRPDVEYYRIDGSVKSEERQRLCEDFNSQHSSAKLFLVSTRAGGIGINLVAANRVVIFDASFNPSNDMQAIFRVFRFGQKKPSYIYRLIAKGTMEEKVYNRQVVKLSLSGRVVDEKQIRRHYTMDELVKMYLPVEDVNEERPIPTPPEDKLLGNLLVDEAYQDIIHRYHEHDSLLENQINERLTEDERQAAWEDYENERLEKKPSYVAGFGLQVEDEHNENSRDSGEDEETMLMNSAVFPTTIDVGKQTDWWYGQQIKKMYPRLPAKSSRKYFHHIKQELNELKALENSLNHFGLPAARLNEMREKYSRLKTKIDNYFRSPTALREAVAVRSRSYYQNPFTSDFGRVVPTAAAGNARYIQPTLQICKNSANILPAKALRENWRLPLNSAPPVLQPQVSIGSLHPPPIITLDSQENLETFAAISAVATNAVASDNVQTQLVVPEPSQERPNSQFTLARPKDGILMKLSR